MQPDFIVTDMFYPWFADAAADSSRLPDWLRAPNGYTRLKKMMQESEKKSYGSLFKSFYEFEGAYEEHITRRSWEPRLTHLKIQAMILISSGWLGKLIKVNEAKGFVEEFEKRVQASNKGYIIWGWAAQLLILELCAIAGLPMVTWPIFAEQFFNEKFLVDVLRIGVSVGAKEWKSLNEFGSEVVKREDIGKTIALLMGGGEESVEMRRVKALSDTAKKAIQVGGSSHNNLKDQIEELKSLKLQKVKHKMEVIEKGDRNA
uniref:Uncharacterized protein n=1 Tax=Glycine max TaxID=3847 RepID=A0A0R0I6U9_SOYBN